MARALRSLLRAPAFSASAVLALALAIGATTAIFSVVDGVLLRPMGYRDEGRLVRLYASFEKLPNIAVSVLEYDDLRTKVPSLESVAVYSASDVTLGGAHVERIRAGAVSDGFFQTLGVQPMLGRTFARGEDEAGRDAVAVITWAAWQKRFGGDPQVLGKTLQLDGAPATVVGVLPRDFRFAGGRDEVFVPAGFTPEMRDPRQRGAHWLEAFGRLRPAADLTTLRRDLAAVSSAARAEFTLMYPAGSNFHFDAEAMRDAVVGSARLPLLLLLGAVGLVLLIACLDVANLLLARGAARTRELAVRSALGADRATLLRELLGESALLAGAGAVLGVLLAAWGLDALLALAPASLPRDAVSVDWRVGAFALGVAVLTTLLFGLAPALQSSRPDVIEALKDGGRTSGPSSSARLRSVLVVAQVALSVVLLAGAGLLLRSFASVTRVDPGFEPSGVVVAHVSGSAYPSDDKASTFLTDVMRAVRAAPGVESAGATMLLPLTHPTNRTFTIEGREPIAGESQSAEFRSIEPGYFATLRIPVLRGRDFAGNDDAAAPRVVVVNDAWARRFSPDRDPIGLRVQLSRHGPNSGWRTIVGVVADTRDLGLERPAPPMVYAPEPQFHNASMALVVRSPLSAGALAHALQQAVSSVDPSQPIFEVRPLDAVVAQALAPRRFLLQLLAGFAIVAALLSALGIYGVTAYSVAQRTREFGVRMAVGATTGNVLSLVLGRALRLASLGLAVGVCGALVASRLFTTLVYGISPHDPLTFVAIVALLGGLALVASLLPARRATAVDPVIALRAE